MKLALWKPALVAIAILVVVTTTGFLIRGNTGSNKTQQVSTADEQAPKAAEPPKLGETPKVVDPAKGGGTHKAAAPKTGASPKTAEERRQLLETVGVLTSAHCYQTYFNIGLIADGKANGTYTDKDAYKLLDSVLSLLDSVDRKLAALSKIDLDKEDRESLEQMRDLSALLRQQGKGLEAFWDSGKDEDAAKYESIRKDSWAAISRLTGIGR